MDSIKKATVQHLTKTFVDEAETAKQEIEASLKEINELKQKQQDILNTAKHNYNQTNDPNNTNTTAEAATILAQAKVKLLDAQVALLNTDSAIQVINACKDSATIEKTKIDDIRHGRNLNERLSHNTSELIAEAERRRNTAKAAAETAKETLNSARITFEVAIPEIYVLLDQVTQLQIAEAARRQNADNTQALQIETAPSSIQSHQPLESKEVEELVRLILHKTAASQQAADASWDQTQQIDAILDAIIALKIEQISMGKRMTLITKSLQAMQLQQDGQVPILSEDDKHELSAKIHAQILMKLAKQHMMQPANDDVVNSATMLNLQPLHAQNQIGLAASIIDNYTPPHNTVTGQGISHSK